jgi:hypothetical protein
MYVVTYYDTNGLRSVMDFLFQGSQQQPHIYDLAFVIFIWIYMNSSHNTFLSYLISSTLIAYFCHPTTSLYFQDGQTEAEIKEYVDNICLKMPKAIRFVPSELQRIVEANANASRLRKLPKFIRLGL